MINPKLRGLPPIYYFNLDHRVDRREYLENEFVKYGITDYHRINSSRYSVDNYDEWKRNVTMDRLRTKKWFLATTVDRMHGIIDWYNSNISETCLVVEDDISFELVNYWNFDWNTFVNNLPCNWECIQLHIIGRNSVKMKLAKWTRNNHSTGCILINRSYAEKLIRLHYVDSKFKFYSNYGYDTNLPEYHYQSVDFVLYQIGITYSIPILTTNYNFISDGYRNGKINEMAKSCDDVVLDWWKNKSSDYTLNDIFYLNSSSRNEFVLNIDREPFIIEINPWS
jgi:hypothetical protein